MKAATSACRRPKVSNLNGPPLTFPSFFLILCVLVCVSSPPALAGDSFKIGVPAEMNVFRQMQRYQPLAEFLSNELGIDAQIVLLNHYGNITDSIKHKAVDAAFLGSFTGAVAIAQLHVEPLARPLFKDGTSTYYGKIFVRKDSGIRTVADMKGKTLALVEATTAGYIFPVAFFRENDIQDLNSYFKQVFYAGSHDATVKAVFEGQADVGAAKNTIYNRVLRENPGYNEKLLVLKNSQVVPSNGFCVCQWVPPSLRCKLKDTLLHLQKNPKAKNALEKLGAVRFVETSRADYQVVNDMAKQAGVDINQYHYSQ
ncbi:MAG: phosphate/phosphite/phosphonate ABC transporter substrate-binding protein [Deltaproteobacteria bacterium]